MPIIISGYRAYSFPLYISPCLSLGPCVALLYPSVYLFVHARVRLSQSVRLWGGGGGRRASKASFPTWLLALSKSLCRAVHLCEGLGVRARAHRYFLWLFKLHQDIPDPPLSQLVDRNIIVNGWKHKMGQLMTLVLCNVIQSFLHGNQFIIHTLSQPCSFSTDRSKRWESASLNTPLCPVHLPLTFLRTSVCLLVLIHSKWTANLSVLSYHLTWCLLVMEVSKSFPQENTPREQRQQSSLIRVTEAGAFIFSECWMKHVAYVSINN